MQWGFFLPSQYFNCFFVGDTTFSALKWFLKAKTQMKLGMVTAEMAITRKMKSTPTSSLINAYPTSKRKP